MIFDFLRRKKTSPVEIDKNNKWNKMWSLWADGKIESPYYELMSYYGEVVNGGHHQFFSNTDNIDSSENVVEILSNILPENLTINMKQAYKAYLDLENDTNIEKSEQDIKKYDSFLNENEEVITEMLKEYSECF